MSPTSIILCMAACFVGLVAALIVVNRFGSMSTRKLVVIAMMVAVYVVLNTVGTIRLGWINISVSALPIIVGALLYGPGGGLMVGLVGAFLGQLMTYGVTATTVLWIIPPAVRGLLIGLYAKRCGYELSRKQLVGVLIVTSLVVTLLNTGAICSTASSTAITPTPMCSARLASASFPARSPRSPWLSSPRRCSICSSAPCAPRRGLDPFPARSPKFSSVRRTCYVRKQDEVGGDRSSV